MSLSLVLALLIALPAAALVLYFLTPRRYESADTVASSYDEWTDDGILEFYWGEHHPFGSLRLSPSTQRLFASEI